MYIYEGFPSLVFANSTFMNNSAIYLDGGFASAGGGLSVGAGAGSEYNLNLHNVSFIGNQCSAVGGGAYLVGGQQSQIMINGGSFENNKAGLAGGLYIDGSVDATVASVLFQGNIADTSGGALVVNTGVKITMSGLTFHNNTALIAGGAVKVMDYNSLRMTDSELSFNRAGRGNF